MNTSLSRYSGILLIVAIVIHTISWLAPVLEEGTGYDAYVETSKMLFNLGDKLEGETNFMDKVTLVCAAISPHTNYIIALCFLLLLFGGNILNGPTLSFFRVSLPICFIINLAWVYGFWNQLDSFRIGYYLWMLSFLLAALAANGYRIVKKQ